MSLRGLKCNGCLNLTQPSTWLCIELKFQNLDRSNGSWNSNFLEMNCIFIVIQNEDYVGFKKIEKATKNIYNIYKVLASNVLYYEAILKCEC